MLLASGQIELLADSAHSDGQREPRNNERQHEDREGQDSSDEASTDTSGQHPPGASRQRQARRCEQHAVSAGRKAPSHECILAQAQSYRHPGQLDEWPLDDRCRELRGAPLGGLWRCG
jgi:hypothetical protein